MFVRAALLRVRGFNYRLRGERGVYGGCTQPKQVELKGLLVDKMNKLDNEDGRLLENSFLPHGIKDLRGNG